jgi:DNA polymerase III subunit delta
VTQVRAEALDAALARGLAPLAWVHGDEPLLALEAADLIRAAARRLGAVERIVFEGGRSFRPEALAAEADSLSLFGEGKLLELRLPNRPGKELGQALAPIIQRLPGSVRLLVSSPRLDRTTMESAWFAAIERNSLVVAIQPVSRQQLPRWIAARLASGGQRADAQLLDFIAERVEGNLLAAHQEVLKLGLMFPPGDLPVEDARAAVLNVARYGAFDLVEPMLAADAARALRTLEGLRAEGEAGPLVLWSIADTTRTLLRLHEGQAAGRSMAAEMRAARVFAPRDRLFEAATRRLRTATLHHALQRTALADRMMKGLLPGDGWKELESVALIIAGLPDTAGKPGGY